MANVETSGRGDPHDWNSLENYIFLHEKRLDEHSLVLDYQLEFLQFPVPDAVYDLIVVEGIVSCSNGLQLEVYKFGDLDRTAARRVRMAVYAYNAWEPGGHNVLRYDNQHRGTEDVYHRHLFDRDTGQLIQYKEMPRKDFPVMHDILNELMELIPPAS